MPCHTADYITVQHVTVQHAMSHGTACSVSNCTPCHCRACCHTVQQTFVRPVNVYPSMHHSLAVGHGKVSLAGAATSSIFCCDKTFVTANISRDKSMLVEKKHNFVSTNVLSRQAYFCRDKRRVCCDKTFVTIKILLVAAPANDRKGADEFAWTRSLSVRPTTI